MLVKLTLIDGTYHLIECADFSIMTWKDTRPEIIKVEVFSFNKRIFSSKRKFSRFYAKHIYPGIKARQEVNELKENK